MESRDVTPNWDAFTGICSVAFGVIYGTAAYTMPRAAFGNPMDPIYFPLGIAAIAVFIGLLLLVKSNFGASVQAYKDLVNEDDVKKNDRKRILYTCVISVAYALLFEHLGYVISTFFFMFLMLTITSGKEAWKQSVVVSIAFSVGIFFVFSSLLSISLPPLPFFE